MSTPKMNTNTMLGITLIAGILLGGGMGYLLGANTEPEETYSGNVVEISMIADQFTFDPSEITVNQGDRVILHVTSKASKENQFPRHSLIINAYGISVDLPVGETVTIDFVADQAGDFPFECGIYCGTDHLDMKGILHVVPIGQAEQEEEETTLTPKTQLFVNAGSWNKSELMLVIQRENRSVLFIDGASHKKIGVVGGIGYQPHTAVATDDLSFAYVVGRGGWVIKIDLDNLEVVDFIKVGDSSRGSAISADQKVLFISNYEPSDFVILNLTSPKLEIVKRYQIPVNYDSEGNAMNSRVASIVDTPNNLMIVALKDLGEVWVVNASDPNFRIEKIHYNAGEILHDAFLSHDGRYYFLASQKSNWMFVMDTTTLEEVAKISTGLKPHPGPGALWGKYAFSPSIGEGQLNVWDLENFTLAASIQVGGPGLFARSYWQKDSSYPYIWWDTVLSTNSSENNWIHVIDGRTILDDEPTIVTLNAGGTSLHPEFSYDGKFVYVSVWQDDGYIVVYDSMTFEEVTRITGVITPTGIFNLGLRVEEYGL